MAEAFYWSINMAEEYTIAQAYVQIIPTTKDIGKTLDQVLGDEGKKAGETAGKNMGTGLSGMAGTIAKAAGAALAGAAAVISKFTADSIETGKAFDSSMSQVAATMGYSVAELNKEGSAASKTFKQLRDFAQQMGQTTAFSATDAADALNYMALAGYDANTSMKMLPTVLNLAAAGGMDLAKASDMVTDAQSALGLEIEDTTVMVDQMAKASSKSNTSVEQLGDAFLKIGATARNVKGGTEELATVLGVLADNGIKGTEGGTHLRNMILSLQQAAKDGAVDFGDFSVSVYDADGNMRSMIDIIGDMQTGMQGMTQEAKDAIVTGVFNKTDLSSINALLGTSRDRFDELSTAIRDSKGAAEEMAGVQLDNLAGDITLMNSALEGAQIAMSDAIAPTLRELTQNATGAIQVLTEKFQALPPEIQQTIGMVGLIGGKALEVIPQVLQLIQTLALLKIAKQQANNVGDLSGSIDGLNQKTPSTAATVAKVAGGLLAFGAACEAAGAAVEANNRATVEAGAAYEIELAQSVEVARQNFDNVVVALGDATTAEQAAAEASTLQKTALEALNTANSDYTDFLIKYPAFAQGYAKSGDTIQDNTGRTVTVTKELWQQYQSLQLRTEEAADALDSANSLVNDSAKYLNDLEIQTEDTSDAFDDAAGAVDGAAVKIKKATDGISKTTKDNLGKVMDAAASMKDAIGNSVKGISSWYDELEKKSHRSTDELITNWQNQINATKTWEEDLNKLLELGIDKGLVERFAKAGPAGDELMMALQDAMINNPGALPDLVAKCNDLFNKQLKMEEGMNAEAQGVLRSTRVMTAGSEAELAQLIMDATGYGKKLPKSMAESIVANAPDVATATRLLKNHAISLDLYGPGYDIGTNLVNGIVKGINAKSDSAVNAIAATSGRIVSKARNTLAVYSPSRVFEEIGMYLPVGMAIGIKENSYKAIDEATSMAEGINDAMGVIQTGYDVSANAIGLNGAGYRAASAGMGYAIPNSYSNSININVYGAKGQSEEAIASAVMRKMQLEVNKRRAAMA